MSVADCLKFKEKRVRVQCYVFHYHVFSSLLFFVENWSTLQASSSLFWVFFPSSTTSRPAVVRVSHEKTFLGAELETRPREGRKSSLFSLLHTPSSGSVGHWSSPGRLAWTREDLPRGTFLAGCDFLSEIWSRGGALYIWRGWGCSSEISN